MLIINCLLLTLLTIQKSYAEYKIGVGIADATGPCVEIHFMGYANPKQKGYGIHLRQYARAFIIDDGTSRFVYVSLDVAMISTGLRLEVIKQLQKQHGSLYSENNVMISGTHTHSAPGGFNMYFLFDISIFGFVQQSFAAYTNGIVRSINKAHKNMRSGRIIYNEGVVEEANINRSPTSYLLNPDFERERYKSNTDKTLTQLKFISTDDESLIGAINWYAVHPTSMNNTNHLISSDNVGYASILLEQAINPKGTLPGKGKFVGAFASTNLGDVSPNIKGPRCEFSQTPCDMYTSKCENERCFASGPGHDMFESTKIIAERIMNVGLELLQRNDGHEVNGPIKVLHQFVNVPDMKVPDYDVRNERFVKSNFVHGCFPAMGYSFAAGTTDGPGEFTFSQGTKSGNPLWDTFRDLLAVPNDEDIKCHEPKPILLATGRMRYPCKWQPNIVSTHMALIGDIVIVGVPGEFTTMSGRRMRSLLTNTFASAGKDVKVIISGLTNTYSSYITTPEEYQAQRYEAASTIFGPNTLTIYLYQYNELAKAIINNDNINPGPTPPNFTRRLISLVTPVVFDLSPFSHTYGDCILEPEGIYTSYDQVHVKFISGNPRNNLMTGQTYLTVEKLDENDNTWQIVATDANWETKFVWERTSLFLGTSQVNIYWDIGPNTPIGTYKIKHQGFYRPLFSSLTSYHGETRTFKIY